MIVDFLFEKLILIQNCNSSHFRIYKLLIYLHIYECYIRILYITIKNMIRFRSTLDRYRSMTAGKKHNPAY